MARESDLDNDAVDRLCRQLFLTERAQEQDHNIQFVSRQLLGRDIDHARLFAMYQRVLEGDDVPFDQTDPYVSLLMLSGIVRVEDARLRVRNRIYADVFTMAWVEANIPEAAIERQRAENRALRIAFERATRAERSAIQLAVDQQIITSVQLLKAGDSDGLLQLLEAHSRAEGDESRRDTIARLWSAWHAACEGSLLQAIDTAPASTMTVAPDESAIAVGDAQGFVTIYDLATGSEAGRA